MESLKNSLLIMLVMLCIASCAQQPLTTGDISANIDSDVSNDSDDSDVSDVSDDSDVVVSRAAVDSKADISTDTSTSEYTDLLDRIRDNMQWKGKYLHEKRVQNVIQYFTEDQAYFDRVMKGAMRYLFYTYERIEQEGFPAEIALLPVVESGFDPYAYSYAKAAGLWQFIPSTAEHFGVREGWWYSGRRDIVDSTTAAILYLDQLRASFNGDWFHALASYNGGPGRVSKQIRRHTKRNWSTSYWDLDKLPQQTKSYVPLLLGICEIILHPDKYGIVLPKIPNKPYFKELTLDYAMNIEAVKRLAAVSSEEFDFLNSGFNQKMLYPLQRPRVLLPVERVEHFTAEYKKYRDSTDYVLWMAYKLQATDTLKTIAKKFDTSVAALMRLNQMQANVLKMPFSMVIPIYVSDFNKYKQYQYEPPRRINVQVELVKRYRLKSGDTLWGVSRQFKVKLRDLMSWNGVKANTILYSGKQIVVAQSRAVAKEPIVLRGEHRHTIIRNVYYPARRGDSLWSIGNKFFVSVNDIIAWNPTVLKRRLQRGDKLSLQVDITRVH